MQPRPFLPALAVLAGVLLLSLMDTLMKGAALAVGTYSASLLRVVIGAAIITPVWLMRSPRWPAPDLLRLHIARGTVSAIMSVTFFYALTKLPIAEAIALSFIAPLLTLYLAAVMLKERIRREAIWASLLGLAGTMVILGGRMGRGAMDDEAILGLGSLAVSALLYAYSFILIRRQSQRAGPIEIATFHSSVSALVLGLAAPFFLVVPPSTQMAGIAASAVLTVGGAMLIAWAYARAETQTLVPLEYSGFLWASLFGFIAFDERITVPLLIGAALIIAGCWIAARKPPMAPEDLP